MNELNSESSPYLLQHANNPIHWKSWNETSLNSAKKENKLLLISIGYSACHWCHVMEHESFEDIEVAEVMNANFINLKIDREERPDIDAVYMKAVQIMTGQGGWPMNVICLPDGRPIWGGTYFRKEEWINALEKLNQLFKNKPEVVFEYAEKLNEGLKAISIIPKNEIETDFNFETINVLVKKWERSFDLDYGGMARAPKFMMPTNFEFLMQYGYHYNNEKVLDFVELTLTKMAFGGLFDTIGGGFSRYAVDMKWHVPHFEKMLYDNGQLVSLYANAFKLTKNKRYKEVVLKTLQFFQKEWLTKEGGFYSALDADSLNTENHYEEGAFYVWTKPKLQELLQEDFDLFSVVFNINSFGIWENENYVLIQNKPLEIIAKSENISLKILEQKKLKWETILYEHREMRFKPRLDDKCITSWNAIMLKGFVDAYKALGTEHYLEIAIKNGLFILNSLTSPNGNLFHSFKNGTPGGAEQSVAKANINGFLEDYAHVIQAYISLYEVTLDESWVQNAKQLTDYAFDNFYDEEAQFFLFNSKQDAALISKHYEVEDNVIPAANSVMADALFKLSCYFENRYYDKICKQMLQNIIPSIDYPSAYSNWLRVMLHYSKKNKELIICGENALNYVEKLNQNYIPNYIIAGSKAPSKLPLLENRYSEKETLFYLCTNKTCQKPTSDFDAICKELAN